MLSWLMLLTHFIFYKGKTFQEVSLFSLYWTKSMFTSRSVWSHFCLFIIDVFSSHCCVDYSWITPCTTKHTQVISASSKAYKNIVSMQGACSRKSYDFLYSIIKIVLRDRWGFQNLCGWISCFTQNTPVTFWLLALSPVEIPQRHPHFVTPCTQYHQRCDENSPFVVHYWFGMF